MSKFVETEFGGTKEILKFPDHYVALAVTVDDTGIVANADGKKIVPKGTIVGGVNGSVLADDTELVQGKYVETVYATKTTGSVATDNAILWKAVAGGIAGNDVKIVLADPGANSQELAVSVVGKVITVSLATGEAGAITSTAKDVADAVNASETASALVVADASGNASNEAAVAAVAETALTGGAAASAIGAEGVLLNDVDVTYGPAGGAMIIHGFIAVDKMPYDENATAASTAAAALNLIKFIQ